MDVQLKSTVPTSTESMIDACSGQIDMGAKFAPDKYHVIHLSKRQRRFNMRARINLGDGIVELVDSTRILGVFLDTKLRWKNT
jgi:hypothetical protein